MQGHEVSPGFSAIVPNTSLWHKLRQVPTLPLTLRDPQHGMFIRGQLPIPWTQKFSHLQQPFLFHPRGGMEEREGPGLAGCSLRDSVPARSSSTTGQNADGGGYIFPAIQGLFGSHCIKLRAKQLSLLQLSLAWLSAQPFEKSQAIKLSTS